LIASAGFIAPTLRKTLAGASFRPLCVSRSSSLERTQGLGGAGAGGFRPGRQGATRRDGTGGGASWRLSSRTCVGLTSWRLFLRTVLAVPFAVLLCNDCGRVPWCHAAEPSLRADTTIVELQPFREKHTIKVKDGRGWK